MMASSVDATKLDHNEIGECGGGEIAAKVKES
jgi:hypothetical protein